MNVLNQKVVELNFNWQAIGEKTVEEAIKQMCADAATGMAVHDDGSYYPLAWDEWIKLPLRECDHGIRTPHMVIRAPRVIVSINYKKASRMKHPKLTTEELGRLHNGRDGYDGSVIPRSDWSMDHVLAKKNNGKHEWANVTLTSKHRNNKKGHQTLEQMGLPKPRILVPKAMPAGCLIKPTHPDHVLFLKLG